MATKFRKGQKVVCIHYKDRPVLTIDSIITNSSHWGAESNTEIWVKEIPKGRNAALYETKWWGPPNWFKAIPKKIRKPRPVTKPRGLRGLIDEGSLCDAGMPGCSCNQATTKLRGF